MARRGGAQQLQVDIRTDEDLEKFLTRNGLLILEVYSDWCGPCLAMVNTLRKCKIEMGGDNLHLATCCADTVTAFRRFYKKSEPTFIFATNGRAVGIFTGSDSPKLYHIIARELEKTLSNTSRPNYGIADLQPVEAEQLRIKNNAIQMAERIETEKQHKKRLDYLNYCTDQIMENLPDIGVTVFGPQVSRDMFKKLAEPADHLKMQCKDRKYTEVTKADFDVVNYACKNPLSPDVIEQMDGKETLICFWKIDESSGPITQVLATYAHELTKERVAPADDDHPQPYPIPPLIIPLKIKFQVEVQEGEIWADDISSEEERRKEAERKAALEKRKSVTAAPDAKDGAVAADAGEDDGEEEESEEEEIAPSAAAAPAPAAPAMGMDLDMGLDDDVIGEEELLGEEEEVTKIITRTKRVKIPPIWIAGNRRTHAALIYRFFRNQTTSFLPPDPPPEPPHIIIAFEAVKRDDILNFVDANKEEIPLYGFFTSDVPADAKLITNSPFKYEELKEQNRTDRLILKVNKVQSYTMLALVPFEPTYVSNNTVTGQQDSVRFFPEDYEVDEEIPEGAPIPRRKRKKMAAPPPVKKEEKPVEAAAEAPAATEAPAAAAPAEGAAEAAAGESEAAPTTEGGETEAAPTTEAPTEGEAAPAAEGEAAPPPAEAEAPPAPAEAEAAPAPAPEAEPAPAPEAPAEAPPAAEEPAPAE